MKKKVLFNIIMVIVLTFAFTSSTFGGNWILNYKNNKLPKNFEAKVSQAGGKFLKSINEIGVIIAEFETREEAELMKAMGFEVMPDISINFLPDTKKKDLVQSNGPTDPYYGYQWHLPAIGADLAWDAGHKGAGVRVAILDSGIAFNHPDLAANIDFASSATFVPGTPNFFDDNGHGTHVAGIVAAADNGFGTVGVAPDATLIGVKVLSASGSGNITWIAQGIIHAADQNVDIINMSLGGTLSKSGVDGYYTARDAAYFINLYRKAISYAKNKGALVIMSAGNEAQDMDHNGNMIKTPAEAGNGVVVSATGPTNDIASYSNYGSSAIGVSAPGGDYMNYPGPNWWYDMILSTTPTGWSWMAGTSMSSPVAAGVAALIVGKYGKMKPSKLKHLLIKSTDDLGKPGTDPYYGKGFVNAEKAVK